LTNLGMEITFSHHKKWDIYSKRTPP